MPVLHGILTTGGGAGFAAAINFLRLGTPSVVDATAYSRDIVTTTAAGNGSFSVTLAGGTWRMRWYRADLASELLLGMPSTGGPYSLDEVTINPGDSYPAGGTRWFNDIQDMVTSDAREWVTGRTLNSYGSDGIRSGWDRVLVTDPAAASLEDNGDSVLTTQDGLAYCVRNWVSS